MKAYVKRLPVDVSYRDDVLIYGADNLYPQRIEGVINRSPITKSALQVTADFINGFGFENSGDVQLGELNANELLAWVSSDWATYDSCAFILDIAMTGEIAEVTPVDFKYIRLGIPRKGTKEITYARVSVDWEGQTPQQLRPKVLSYPLWPGSPEAALEIINEWNYDQNGEFNGFLLYITPRTNTYPLATVDAVIDSSQTNGEIQLFELAGVQNGFLGATLLKHPGKIESNEERLRINNMVQSIRGAENANSVIVWEIPDGFDSDVLEQFPANAQDKLFESTNRATVNRIVQALAIPPSLLGIMPENSFFNMTEIDDSYTYFNVRTNNRRVKLARLFNDLGRWFVTPTTFGGIIPQTFTYEGAEVKQVTPEPTPTPQPPDDDVNN